MPGQKSIYETFLHHTHLSSSVGYWLGGGIVANSRPAFSFNESKILIREQQSSAIKWVIRVTNPMLIVYGFMGKNKLQKDENKKYFQVSLELTIEKNISIWTYLVSRPYFLASFAKMKRDSF